MRRPLVPLVLLATLSAAAPAAAAPAAAAPSSGEPRPGAGRAVVVATAPGTSFAVFAANRPVDLDVIYRRRSSASVVRLAVRPGARSCPSRPAAADRRRGGVAGSSPSGRSFFATSVRARPRVGVNRVCVWAKEGSRSFGRPVVARQTFARRLFSATAAQGTQGDLAVSAFSAQSTSPLRGTATVQSLAGGAPCGVETRPLRVLRIAGIYDGGFSIGTGSVCTGFAAQAASGASSASLAVGQVPVGTPAAVVGHVGDCDAGILRSVPVPRALAAAVVTAAGCRPGRVLEGTDETAARSGRPASQNAFGARYRGRAVNLAPKGTRIDLVVDSRR